MDHSKYLSHDTIHALATEVGGALSIVRMSGPHAIEALAALAIDVDVRERSARSLFRAKLFATRGGEKTEQIDDAMAVLFRAPLSQTGEDLVELYLHGGAVVAERVLEALEKSGSRQALPGEFSFRAVRNGKMNVVQAQAIADLIAAKNAGAAALALEKMEGSQAKLVIELAEGLRKLSTMGELGIDFADQDVEELSLPVLKKQAAGIVSRLSALGASFDRGQKIQEGVRVAFVGRPNAGKSSFFNALLGEDRSIVSEIAGTTRDVVRETLNLKSTQDPRAAVTLRIEDTAGIRAATEDRIEQEGISRSVRAASQADFVVFIVDGGNEAAWQESLSVWRAISAPFARAIAILTKTDLADPAQVADSVARLRGLGIESVYAVSSPQHLGIEDAAEGIIQFCARFVRRDPGEVLLTRLDHLRAVRETLSHLERALSAPSEDLFAADLRQALLALGPVIGETLPDDILGRIFSEFCIGK